MKSFNEIFTELQDITGDTATATLTIFKRQINDSHHLLIAKHGWPSLEKTANLTSVAGQEAYELPIDTRSNKVIEFRFEESATVMYRPRLVESSRFWEYLQALNSSDSNVTQFFYVQGETILLYPAPADGSKTMRVRYRKIAGDMTQDDYTTGTIVTTTNGGTGVVGTGTPNWAGGLSPEATLHIRITKTASDSAKSGDGRWYEISSITDDTNLVLVKNYEGTSIATGTAAYTIGEMPLLPEAYHSLLFYRPLALYYEWQEDTVQATRYWNLYDNLFKEMRSNELQKGEGIYVEPLGEEVDDLRRFRIKNISGEAW